METDFLDDVIYTGEEIKPLDNKNIYAIVGRYDEGEDIEELLEYGKDFTTSYKNNINAGTAEVTIIGINNYTGKITKKFKIYPLEIYTAVLELSIPEKQIYSGEKKEPVLTIKSANGKLILGKDYKVEYKDNISAGIAQIIIMGINNYNDIMQVEFQIYPKDFETMGNKLKINIPDQEYTGKKLEPKMTVKDGKTTLKRGTDYTVSYKNNTKVGTATAIITGQGNYEGTVNKTFKIIRTTQVKVEKVSLNATSKTLDPEKTVTLKATIEPSNASNKEIEWSSNNKKVATVDKNGKVTAKALGEATITVKTKSGNKQATCKIKVVVPQVEGFSVKEVTHNTITLKWNKNSYAKQYKVWMSTTGKERFLYRKSNN